MTLQAARSVGHFLQRLCQIGCNAFCVAAGEGEARGVEGQVQQLFQDAQDPEILAKAFVGWAAWV